MADAHLSDCIRPMYSEGFDHSRTWRPSIAGTTQRTARRELRSRSQDRTTFVKAQFDFMPLALHFPLPDISPRCEDATSLASYLV